jgi:uncharacterized protein YdhG (YjbR/CyaY superfamily)
MKYEVSISGRAGTESDERAQNILKHIEKAMKEADIQYNMNIFDGSKNVVVTVISGKETSLPELEKHARLISAIADTHIVMKIITDDG